LNFLGSNLSLLLDLRNIINYPRDIEDELDRLIQSNPVAFDHSKILTDFTNWRNATQRTDEENKKIPTFWSTKKREAGTEEIFRGKPSD